LSRARKYPSVWGEESKPVHYLANFRLFPHTHLCLRSYWVPGRRLRQSSLDKFILTSISGPMRRAVTYLSMDFGDFNFSSCEYHPYREQYPISVALRVHSRRTGHENPLDDDLFSHWYCREPNLCGGRSCRIFSHRLPQLSLLELRGRRLRCGLRHNGGSNWAPRRCLDHLHRRFGHFRWGRVLCAYRRSGHGTPSPKLLEFGVEEFLITDVAEKAACFMRLSW